MVSNSAFSPVCFAVVPEDGPATVALQSAHREAALVQSASPAHCAFTVPSAVPGTVHLRHRATATKLPVENKRQAGIKSIFLKTREKWKQKLLYLYQ